MEQLKQRLEILLGNYQQDLQIYQEILLETEKIETRLTEGAAQRLGSSGSVSFQEGGAAPAPDSDSDPEIEGLDEVDDIERFVSWRQEKLQDISQRRTEVAEDRDAVCKELETDNLDEEVIQRAYPELLDPWRRTMADLQENAVQVLVRDEKIFKQINMEMEFMKLEMHRMQDVKRSRKAYNPQIMEEAKFIDKNR